MSSFDAILASMLAAAINSPVAHAQQAPGNPPQDGRVQTQMLHEIASAAERVCNKIQNNGSASSITVQGDVKAELKGLSRMFGNAGIAGSGQAKDERYENVSREDLAKLYLDSSQCKLTIFNTLQEKLIAPLTPPKNERPSERSQDESKLGDWQGIATCGNGQNFSMTLSLTQQRGQTATGRFIWDGSNRGNVSAVLSPAADPYDPDSYVLFPNGSNTYRWNVTIINGRILEGASMGRESCRIRLER